MNDRVMSYHSPPIFVMDDRHIYIRLGDHHAKIIEQAIKDDKRKWCLSGLEFALEQAIIEYFAVENRNLKIERRSGCMYEWESEDYGPPEAKF